jgi:hypothetical protein
VALDNFIPEIWSARLLDHLDKKLVFKDLVNTDYEGDIKGAGSTVKINQIGEVTISDYTKNSDLGDPETLTGAQQVLNIDQAKSFNFQVDDIDKAQTTPKLMDEAMKRAAYGIGDVIDMWIAGFHSSAGIKLDNSGSGYTVGSGSGEKNAYDLLVEVGAEMDAKNVPDVDRWAVIPPWFHAALLKTDEYKQAWQDYMRTGTIPVVAGMAIKRSNNLKTSSTTYYVLAGTKGAISYAGQVATIEPYRMEKRFADAVKGLYVYGAKVVQPNCFVRVSAIKGT